VGLHAFYVVTQDMTDAELRHRRLIKQVDPSLPHRAGRTYVPSCSAGIGRKRVLSLCTKERAITVGVVIKPKPDLERYTRRL
jgi:hypothetical protein